MLVGYMRVSKADGTQTLDLQRDVQGNIGAVDANSAAFGKILLRTFSISAIVTLCCLLLGYPMALGLMVFYALCLQCSSTIAVMRRETGSWRWPAAAWTYMTTLGYLGAFLCYRVGTAILG